MSGAFGEPWSIDPPDLERGGLDWERFDLVSDDGHQVATVEGFSGKPHTPEEAFRYAQRICACVEALTGIEDPARAIDHARQALERAAEILTYPTPAGTDASEFDKAANQCLRALKELRPS